MTTTMQTTMQTTGQQQSKSVRRRRPMAVAADLRMTMRKSGSQSAPRYLQDNNQQQIRFVAKA